MTITYVNGKSTEAVLLWSTENKMRLAVEGAEDAFELAKISGVWVSADCEPVTVQYAWQLCDKKPAVTEEDCICSHQLAARLITLLLSGCDDPCPVLALPADWFRTAAAHC